MPNRAHEASRNPALRADTYGRCDFARVAHANTRRHFYEGREKGRISALDGSMMEPGPPVLTGMPLTLRNVFFLDGCVVVEISVKWSQRNSRVDEPVTGRRRREHITTDQECSSVDP